MTTKNYGPKREIKEFARWIGKDIMSGVMERILTVPAVFDALRPHLTEALLIEVSHGLALLWHLIVRHHDRHGVLPSQDILLTELQHAMRDEDSRTYWYIPTEEIAALIRSAFAKRFNSADIDWALERARRFLQERTIKQTIAFQEPNLVPLDATEMFTELSSLIQQYEIIGCTDSDDVIPANWAPAAIELRPTGIPVFDRFTGGGPAVGELYGIVGPVGMGKTLTGVQLITQAVKLEHSRQRQKRPADTRISFLLAYETASDDEFRVRLLSSMASVSKTNLERGPAAFSTSKRLHDYERQRYARSLANGALVPGETERIAHYRPILNRYMAFGDMTGHDARFPLRGMGGVDEICAYIDHRLRKVPNSRVGRVVVDYLDLLVDRQMAVASAKTEPRRFGVERAMRDLKKKVARRYNCDVWVIQQLSGRANERPEGAASKSTDAKEAKLFYENCDFCFAFGIPTKDNLITVTNDKHRRVPRPRCPEVVRLYPDLQRLESTNGLYGFDFLSQRIISNCDRDQIKDPETAPVADLYDPRSVPKV